MIGTLKEGVVWSKVVVTVYLFSVPDIYDFLWICLQTFLNDEKVPEDDYVTLEHLDTVRFGSDILLYTHVCH